MTDTTTRGRGRRIELIAPISYAGNTISEVMIAPARLDHVIRWGQGQIAGSLALLAELSGLSEGALRQLEYPDADDVLAAFMAILPPVIRTDIERGAIPLATPQRAAEVPIMPRAPLAAGEPVAEEEEDAGPGFDAGAAAAA